MPEPAFDPTTLAGVDNNDLGQHAPEPGQTPSAPEPVTPPEPTVAEIIAAELGKVTQHIDDRFAQYDQKLEGLKPAPASDPQPQGQEWQPKTWADFPKLVEQVGREAAEKVIAEREANAKAANDAQAAGQAQIDTFIDQQVATLEKTGKLPAIVDESNPEDAGKLARQELFAFAAYIGSPNLEAAQAALDGLHMGNQRFDYRANKILQSAKPNPGRLAPVGSSGGSGGVTTSNGPTYKEIATLSTAQLLDKYPNGY